MKGKSIVIFGYGSLINEDSLRKTVPSAKNIVPVRLQGYTRVFDFPSSTRLCEKSGKCCTVLNAFESKKDSSINGIIFEMDEEDLQNLIYRETGYELIEVEVENYYDENVKIVAYFFKAPKYESNYFLFDSEKQMEYLDLCVEGCKIFGDEFLREFLETTYIENKSLREIFKEKDNLLFRD